MIELKMCECGGEPQLQIKKPQKAEWSYASVVCKNCGKSSKWIMVRADDSINRVADDWNNK